HPSPLYTLPFLELPPPPPSSTLFPYTTLFRSRVDQHQAGAALDRLELEAQARLLRLVVDDPRWVELHDRVLLRRLVRTAPGEGGDRKSTRLNSSHVSISYAVFCLKKKKK